MLSKLDLSVGHHQKEEEGLRTDDNGYNVGPTDETLGRKQERLVRSPDDVEISSGISECAAQESTVDPGRTREGWTDSLHKLMHLKERSDSPSPPLRERLTAVGCSSPNSNAPRQTVAPLSGKEVNARVNTR